MLEAELNSIKAVSAGGVKLALLHVLYDVQRVRETFEQVKAKVASNEYTRDLLEIDEDVDYLMWAERLKKCVSIQKLKPPVPMAEIRVIRTGGFLCLK